VTTDHLECVAVDRGNNEMGLEDEGCGCAQDSCRSL